MTGISHKTVGPNITQAEYEALDSHDLTALLASDLPAHASRHATGGNDIPGTMTLTAPTAASVPLTLVGAALQTVNLEEWKNNGGTVLSAVNKDGWLGLGRAAGPRARAEVMDGAVWLSDSDVAQASGLYAADVYGVLEPYSGAAGGLQLTGISDSNNYGVVLFGLVGSGAPTKPPLYLWGVKASEGSISQLTETEQLLAAGYPGAEDALRLYARGRTHWPSSGVAHGMTDRVPTDVYGRAAPVSLTAGGWLLEGLTDSDATGLTLVGTMGATDPTDTTPALLLVGQKRNTTDAQAMGAAETVLRIDNYLTPLMTLLGNGYTGLGGAVAPASMLDLGAGALTLAEMAAPGAPAANNVVVYSDDDNGVTRIMAKTADGVVHGLAPTLDALHGPIVDKGRLFSVHTRRYQDWTHTLVAGGAQQSGNYAIFLQTSATASSSALAYSLHPHLTRSSSGGQAHLWDMTTPWEICFNVARTNSDAECVAYMQFKQVTTHGDLAAVGLGVRIDNLACYGESYGSARGSVSMGNLTDTRSHKIGIRLYPGVKVEFYLDGVLVATQSTAANVPNAVFAGNGNLVVSIANGVTGGVDCQLSANGWDVFVKQ